MLSKVILAIIQGLTEFLPVSSSGHLALISNLISEPDLFFMVSMHFASLFAVLIYFRKDIKSLLNFKDKKNFHNYKILVLGILPACIFGYFFSELINRFLSNYLIIGTGFLISSVFLFSSKISAKNQKNKISLKDSFIIGLSQVIALLPGVSRSGVTTSTGILRRISSETSGKFSFIMFIPLAIGAQIFEFKSFYINFQLVFCFLICFFVSLFSIKVFFKFLKKDNFWLFGIWTLLMSLTSFLLFFF